MASAVPSQKIYAHIAPNGTSIVPAADDFADSIRQAVQTEQVLSFGAGGEIFATEIELQAQSATFKLNTPQGVRQVNLPFAGGIMFKMQLLRQLCFSDWY